MKRSKVNLELPLYSFIICANIWFVGAEFPFKYFGLTFLTLAVIILIYGEKR